MSANDGNASGTIQSVSREARLFPPSADFAARALINDAAAYEKLYRRSIDDPEGFWAETARAELTWIRDFKKVLDWKLPYSKWFEDGQINLSANCLDRHLATRGDKVAIDWEGEPGDSRKLTYRELHAEVCKFANAMKALGIVAGDRVAIYMPMIPEAAVAMLACTRIGATHTVVFGGFSAEALRDRINDCGAKLCITADGGWRRGKSVPLKANVDGALAQTPSVKSCIVARRTKRERSTCRPAATSGGTTSWRRRRPTARPRACPPSTRCSSSTRPGRPGSRRGSCTRPAGYLLGAHLTTKYVFDLHDDDIFWCTADIGWVTGHSYVVYGPLSNGATSVMYEGAPDHPEKDRFWSIIERRKVSIFYTAPTAIRAFVRWGNEFPKQHDLSSLRLLGSVGEPINPEAWMWYHEIIGGGALPDRRHLVADGDGRDHDDAAARASRPRSRAAARGRSSASSRRWSSATARRARPTRAASW